MSKASAETALALFNRMEGRGDVLSIHIEDGAKLAALPKGMFADIFYPLFQWWVNGAKDTPDDPRDKMVFDGLKTHQLENAVKRGISLKNWHENSCKGGRPKSAKKPSGNQAETKRVQLEDQDEVQDEDASSKSSICTSSSVGVASRNGLTPSACTPLSAGDARKILKMDAPELNSHAGLKTPKGTPTVWASLYAIRNTNANCVMVASRIFRDDISEEIFDREEFASEDFAISDYSLENNEGVRFAKQLAKARETMLGEHADKEATRRDNIFKRTLLSAALDSAKSSVENRPAFILARLTKMTNAVNTLYANDHQS